MKTIDTIQQISPNQIKYFNHFAIMSLQAKEAESRQKETKSNILPSFCHYKILTFYLRKIVIFRAFFEREEVSLKNTLIFEISESHHQM